MNKEERARCIWYDRKRTFLGLPWSFTKYAFSEDRFFIEKGFFTTTFDEVRLYRILDIKLTQKLWQKIFGVGTINVYSSDKAQGEFQILNIKKPKYVKEILSKQIEQQRDAKRVVNREMMNGPDFDELHPDADVDGYDSVEDIH